MDCPTFGSAESQLALRVQSLDRKGDFKGNDRHRVLKVQACRKTRSITALNFYAAAPQIRKTVPPPAEPKARVAAEQKRPPPRFMELFNPPDMDDAPLVSRSGASTPFSEASASQPVTPQTTRIDLPSRQAHSYFAYSPHKQPSLSPPSPPRLSQNRARGWDNEELGRLSCSSDDWDESDEDEDARADHETVHFHSLDDVEAEWTARTPREGGFLAGTFGRT